MINFQPRDTEQPNENQSSWGPSNQQNSSENSQAETSPGWGSSVNSGISGGMSGMSGMSGDQYKIQPLPWQQNDMQQPTSAPSWQNQGQTQQPTGTVGQYMPEGYDTGKFSDPTNANSTKYQVGRILSQYAPGEAGLQQAAAELSKLGINVIGRDKIRLPDGTTTDVGKSFSDPNANHAWQYNWSGPGGDSGGNNFGPSMNVGFPTNFQGSMFGNPQQQQMQQQIPPQLMQMLMGSMNNPNAGSMMDQNNQMMKLHQQQPDLYQNAGQNQMDISSFLGGPSNGMLDSGMLGNTGISGGMNPMLDQRMF